MILERVAPGRELPNAPGWYGRALLVNFFSSRSRWPPAVCRPSFRRRRRSSIWTRCSRRRSRALSRWVVGTFFFYWWHRHPPCARLLARLPSTAPLAGPDRGADLVLQAPARNPRRLAAVGAGALPAARRARWRAPSGTTSSPRRASTSTTRTSSRHAGCDTSSRRRSCTPFTIELDVHRHNFADLPLLGSPLRHLSRQRRFSPRTAASHATTSAICAHAALPRRVRSPAIIARDPWIYLLRRRARPP